MSLYTLVYQIDSMKKQKQKTKNNQNKPQSKSHLDKMKKLDQMNTSQERHLSNVYKHILNEESREIDYEELQAKKSFEQTKQQQLVQQANECALCLQSDFQAGKYKIDCNHIFCNDCYRYLSNITSKCPMCFKNYNSVLIINDGFTKIIKSKPIYQHQPCTKCKDSTNCDQMYYCDSCEKTCIHVYCETKLLQISENKEQQVWYCPKCKKNFEQKAQKQSKIVKSKGNSRDAYKSQISLLGCEDEIIQATYNLRNKSKKQERSLESKKPKQAKKKQ